MARLAKEAFWDHEGKLAYQFYVLFGMKSSYKAFSKAVRASLSLDIVHSMIFGPRIAKACLVASSFFTRIDNIHAMVVSINHHSNH